VGCCGRGASPHIFDENLTTKMLRDILAEYFLPHLPEITGMPEGPWLSFRDGDPKYRSRLVQSRPMLARPIPDNRQAAPTSTS